MDAVAIAPFNLKILHLATGAAIDLKALNSTWVPGLVREHFQ